MATGIHDPRYEAIVSVLRDVRVRSGLSQSEVGRMLGKRQQYVSKYESGERRLDIVEFVDVALALKADWRELIQGVL